MTTTRRRTMVIAGVAGLALSAAGLPQGAPPASTIQIAAAQEPGVRLAITGVVRDKRGRPIAGAEIHVYQTDAGGRYTPEKPMDEPHARLAGWLRTDAEGRFELRTIRPGGYPQPVLIRGRKRKIPAHIHIDVTAPGHAGHHFQAVFADDPLLAEPYWQEWVRRLGQPVLELRPGEQGATGALTLVLER